MKLEYDMILSKNSLKLLLTSTDTQEMNKHIALMKEMQTIIEKFTHPTSGYLVNIEKYAGGNMIDIPLTPSLMKDMESAASYIAQLKPLQWQEITKDSNLTKSKIVKFLDDFKKYIETEKDGSDSVIEDAENYIKDLDYKKVKTEDDINTFVAEMNDSTNKYNKLTAVQRALIDDALTSKISEYQKAASEISTYTDLKNDIAALSSVSEQDFESTVIALETRYNDLSTIHKYFIDGTTQFKKYQDKLVASKLDARIDKLTLSSPFEDIKAVWNVYDNLTAEYKEQITKKEVLESIWTKRNIINNLNEAISKIDLKTAKEDLLKLQLTYENLETEEKALVENYSEVEKLLAAITERETNATIEEKALALIEQIKRLTEESSPAEIDEARASYNEIEPDIEKLTDTTKSSLTKQITVLKSLEKHFKEQKETAEKEAQVVIDRINKIDLNTYTATQINNIRNAYNGLSVLAQKVVKDSGALDKLISAESHIIHQNTIIKEAKQAAAAFDEYMENITRNATTAEIAAARALYNRLSYEAKRYVETYNKLVRLETMWKDPEYLELVYTYYPDYINAIKPGGIEIKKPEYDPLYIPDDSVSHSVANHLPGKATWATYEDMTYQNGRYMTKITSTQVKNLSDPTMTLKAGDMEVILPVADLKAASGSVGVTLSVLNNQLNIQLTEGSTTKTFSEYVEVRVPMSKLNGNKDKRIERVASGSNIPASFKVEDSNFVIRTKTSGVFQVAKITVTYNDLGTTDSELTKDLYDAISQILTEKVE